MTMAVSLGGCSAAGETLAEDESNVDATVSNEVNLTDLQYRNGELSFRYVVGGGCQTHAVRSKLVDLEAGTFEHAARLEVFDVSPTHDMCEAMLQLGGTANLGKLLDDVSKGEVSSATVRLPSVRVNLPTVGRTPVAARTSRGGSANPLTQMSVDPRGVFSFSYQTAGGCAEHTPKVVVEFSEVADPLFGKVQTAKVAVDDMTEAPDLCEGVISVDGSVNLAEQIAESLGAARGDQSFINVELPLVRVTR